MCIVENLAENFAKIGPRSTFAAKIGTAGSAFAPIFDPLVKYKSATI